MTSNEREGFAEAKLRRAFADAFAPLEALSVNVADIHSHGYAEDSRTLMIMATLENGHTAVVSVCMGQPISVQVVD